MAFRTKKISQMDPKGANLASTDLLEISELVSGSYVTKSITGAEIIASVPPTSVEWGDIGGVLSTQIDLQNALNGKVDTNATITGATKTKITYDSKGLVTSGADATTADIADSLNKRYVTDAKLTVLNNTSGTNTGDQTLSGLGGVPTTRTLTINGTTQDLSADRTFTISTGITIGTTAITSGTVGRILFEGTGNVVSESANLFWDNTNGRLGIGTSSPSAIIHSVGSVTASGAIARGNYLNNTLVASANSDVLVGLDVQPTFTNGAFTGVANLAIRASTTSTSSIGKLLIGTTSNPYSLGSLVVEHPASFASWFKRGANMIEINPSSSGVNIITSTVDTGGTQLPLSLSARKINADLYLQTTGNIGIGTTTDAGFKLDVNGTARLNTLTIGLGGGQVSSNTALGFQALNANTTAIANTMVGYQAGLSITTSQEMTGIGYLALRSNASASTAIGSQAMSNATGGQSVAVGANALYSGTGVSNTAIGQRSLIATTSGTGNTAIGRQSGGANTTGGNNIFIGNGADGVSATDSNRTWIGNSSTTTSWLGGSLLLGTTAEVASSIATLESTTKGFLPPRMTTTQKNAIATPATGLMVYDTTLNLISVYNGTTWITL